MFYKGRLRVAGDPGEGIPVDLSLDDVYVDLRADGEELGRWRMDVVEMSRLEGNDFRLLLDGEEMIFRATDPLGFAYNAITTVEEISSRLRKRRRSLFRRKTTEPDMLRGAPVEEPASADPKPTSVSADRIADLGSLLPPTGGVERPPSEDELFEEFSVDVGEDDAGVSFGGDDVVSADSRPAEPIIFDPEIFDLADESSEGERSVDPPPQGERGQSPVRTGEDSTGAAGHGTESEPSVASGDAEPFDPEVIEDLVADETNLPTIELIDDETVPGLADGDQVDEAGDASGAEPDLIEVDVGEVDDMELEPLEAEAPVDDLRVEATTDSQAEPRDSHTIEAEPSGTQPELEPVDAESLESEPMDAEPVEPDSASSPFDGLFAATTREGEVDVAEDDDEARPAAVSAPNPRAKRRGLFGLGRGDQQHEHDYQESRTVGGITRRVCSVCGHVSFAGDDVYEEWK